MSRSIAMRMLGDLTGRALLAFSELDAGRLCDLILRRPVGPPRALGEMEQSGLKEVGNIVCSAYLTALSNFMRMMLLPSVPSLITGPTTAAIAQSVDPGERDSDLVFCVDTAFRCRGHRGFADGGVPADSRQGGGAGDPRGDAPRLNAGAPTARCLRGGCAGAALRRRQRDNAGEFRVVRGAARPARRRPRGGPPSGRPATRPGSGVSRTGTARRRPQRRHAARGRVPRRSAAAPIAVGHPLPAAVAAHQHAEWSLAEACYRAALADPGHRGRGVERAGGAARATRRAPGGRPRMGRGRCRVARRGEAQPALALMRRGAIARARELVAPAAGRGIAALDYLGGYMALAAHDAVAAAALLESAVRIDPDLARGYFTLGLARERLGDHLGAVGATRHALLLSPWYVPQVWLLERGRRRAVAGAAGRSGGGGTLRPGRRGVAVAGTVAPGAGPSRRGARRLRPGA